MATDRTDTLKVDGMVCDACVGHVASALKGLSGVQSAEVSLADKQAVVTYDPARVDISRMISAIEEDGYDARISSG